MKRHLGPLALAAAVGWPLFAALWAAVHATLDAQAWAALWQDPLTLRAWGLTLWTGLASTVLA